MPCQQSHHKTHDINMLCRKWKWPLEAEPAVLLLVPTSSVYDVEDPDHRASLSDELHVFGMRRGFLRDIDWDTLIFYREQR